MIRNNTRTTDRTLRVRGAAVAAAALTALVAGAMALPSYAVGASTHATHQGRSTANVIDKTTKKVKFTGKYAGTVTLIVNASTYKVTVSSVTGRGTATIVGKGTVAGSGSATPSGSACPIPINGTAHITGPGGKISLRVLTAHSTGCSSGSSGKVTVTFKGSAIVTGATGKAKGLTGTI